MRTDLQVRNEGCRRFRNAMNMAGGGFKRRWGTADLAPLGGMSRLETYGVGADDARLLVFSEATFTVLDLDGNTLQTLPGCPWQAVNLYDMQIAIEDGKIVVACRAWAPVVLTLDAGVWSIATLTFAEGLNGSSLQPYWIFHRRGISLTPSAYSGSGVTLETSEPFFVPEHMGVRIRYTGVEIEITAVTDSETAVGTVIGALYPTLNVTVASSAGFSVGQVVEGDTTRVRGAVAAVPDGTHVTVQLLDGFTQFDPTEPLVGPTAKSTISAVAVATSPAPTTEWDEPLISLARGWPGACALHRNRLFLGDFPQAQSVIAASATSDIQDFNVGTALETDAVIERVSRESSLGLRHFGSTEQLLVFTENGVSYVPEQVAAPFSATNYELLKIGPEKAAKPQPLFISEGMGFVEQYSGRLMMAIATGNVRRSWEIADLSELAFHLMGTPVELELMAALSESDRLVPVLRDDGKIAVLTYRRGAQFSAWSLWSTRGAWRSIVVAAGTLYAVAEREVDGVVGWRLEKFDPTAWADGMVDLPAVDTPFPDYAGETVGVWEGPGKLGEFVMDGDGVLNGIDPGYGAVRIGFDFPVTVESPPPVDQQMGLRPNYKITRVDVDVIDSVGFKGNGRNPSGWSGAIGGATVPMSGVRRFRPLGRAKYPTFTIQQDIGGPLEIRSITMEVTS